jgi:hypothetical protein
LIKKVKIKHGGEEKRENKSKTENGKKEKNRWQWWQRGNLLGIARNVTVSFLLDCNYCVHSRSKMAFLLGKTALFEKLLERGMLME